MPWSPELLTFAGGRRCLAAAPMGVAQDVVTADTFLGTMQLG